MVSVFRFPQESIIRLVCRGSWHFGVHHTGLALADHPPPPQAPGRHLNNLPHLQCCRRQSWVIAKWLVTSVLSGSTSGYLDIDAGLAQDGEDGEQRAPRDHIVIERGNALANPNTIVFNLEGVHEIRTLWPPWRRCQSILETLTLPNVVSNVLEKSGMARFPTCVGRGDLSSCNFNLLTWHSEATYVALESEVGWSYFHPLLRDVLSIVELEPATGDDRPSIFIIALFFLYSPISNEIVHLSSSQPMIQWECIASVGSLRP